MDVLRNICRISLLPTLRRIWTLPAALDYLWTTVLIFSVGAVFFLDYQLSSMRSSFFVCLNYVNSVFISQQIQKSRFGSLKGKYIIPRGFEKFQVSFFQINRLYSSFFVHPSTMTHCNCRMCHLLENQSSQPQNINIQRNLKPVSNVFFAMALPSAGKFNN